jgi:hypothetical protein
MSFIEEMAEEIQEMDVDEKKAVSWFVGFWVVVIFIVALGANAAWKRYHRPPDPPVVSQVELGATAPQPARRHGFLSTVRNALSTHKEEDK